MANHRFASMGLADIREGVSGLPLPVLSRLVGEPPERIAAALLGGSLDPLVRARLAKLAHIRSKGAPGRRASTPLGKFAERLGGMESLSIYFQVPVATLRTLWTLRVPAAHVAAIQDLIQVTASGDLIRVDDEGIVRFGSNPFGVSEGVLSAARAGRADVE